MTTRIKKTFRCEKKMFYALILVFAGCCLFAQALRWDAGLVHDEVLPVQITPISSNLMLVASHDNGYIDLVNLGGSRTNLGVFGPITYLGMISSNSAVLVPSGGDVVVLDIRTKGRKSVWSSDKQLSGITNYGSRVLLRERQNQMESLTSVDVSIGKAEWSADLSEADAVATSQRRIYVAYISDRNSPARRFKLRCLSVSDGSELWNRTVSFPNADIYTTRDLTATEFGDDFWLAHGLVIQRLSAVDGSLIKTYRFTGSSGVVFSEDGWALMQGFGMQISPEDGRATPFTKIFSLRTGFSKEYADLAKSASGIAALNGILILTGSSDVKWFDVSARNIRWERKGMFRAFVGQNVVCLRKDDGGSVIVVRIADDGSEAELIRYRRTDMFRTKR
jgi:hypothetical protein